jgi:hypothetical protein
MTNAILLFEARRLNEQYVSSFNRSFYVAGTPKDIARAIASMSSNATDRGESVNVPVANMPEDFRLELRFPDDLCRVYAVRITYQNAALRKIAEVLKCKSLRALVLGYRCLPKDVSEVVPCDFELNQKITLDSVIRRIDFFNEKVE